MPRTAGGGGGVQTGRRTWRGIPRWRALHGIPLRGMLYGIPGWRTSCGDVPMFEGNVLECNMAEEERVKVDGAARVIDG